jgi:hypothetical protein
VGYVSRRRPQIRGNVAAAGSVAAKVRQVSDSTAAACTDHETLMFARAIAEGPLDERFAMRHLLEAVSVRNHAFQLIVAERRIFIAVCSLALAPSLLASSVKRCASATARS